MASDISGVNDSLRADDPVRKVVVIGAGGLGREVRDAIDAVAKLGGPSFGGFLDDSAQSPDVLGPLSVIGEHAPGARFIVAIGDSALRRQVVSSAPRSAEFATVIHPTAVVSQRAKVGRGVFLAPLSYVGAGAVVADHTIVNVHSQVGHDASAGPFATLSPQSALNGHATLGEGCLLGTAATVDVGVAIGRWSKVSAGSRVTKSCGDGFLLAGNPATGRAMFRVPLADT